MKFFKWFLIFIFILGTNSDLLAQKYGTAIGLRGAVLTEGKLGITLQQRIADQQTVEAILAFNESELRLTPLLEWHQKKAGKNLNWYYGVGPHAGVRFDDKAFLGVSSILGMEYKLIGLPLVLSADVKPALNLNHPKRFELQPALSARYVLVSNRDYNKKKRKKKVNDFFDRIRG